MTTTQIFIEHLIAGILAAVWIALGAAAFLDLAALDLSRAAEPSNWLVFLAFAVVYPLGVLVDHLADEILKKTEATWKDLFDTTIREIFIEMDKTAITDYLGYMRLRIRIMRTAMLNFGMLAIAGPLFVLLQANWLGLEEGNVKWGIAICGFAISASIAVGALWVWRSVTKSFYEKGDSILKLLKRQGQN